MYLDKNRPLFGYPASLIRKLFRILKGGDYSIGFFVHHLKISETDAVKFVNKLIEEGYLKKDHKYQEDTYSTTIKGNSLAMASFATPITRRKTKKILAELIDRAKFVNESKDHLYKVRRITLFGSYLSNKDRINDIDVDIILERKFPEDIQKEKEDVCIAKAINSGKVFNTFIDQLAYPMLITKVFLKKHSRALSIHYEDKIIDQTKNEIIYELKD